MEASVRRESFGRIAYLESADHQSSIRVAVSTPTRLPVMSATRRQCPGVRPAWVVPSGRMMSRSRPASLQMLDRRLDAPCGHQPLKAPDARRTPPPDPMRQLGRRVGEVAPSVGSRVAGRPLAHRVGAFQFVGHGFPSFRARVRTAESAGGYSTASRCSQQDHRPSRPSRTLTSRPNLTGAPQIAHCPWPSGRMAGPSSVMGAAFACLSVAP
jgi:hypothetical protein